MLYGRGDKARLIAEKKAKDLMEAQQLDEMNSKALAIRSNRRPIFSSNPGNIAFVPVCPGYVTTIGNNLIFIFKMYGSIKITYIVYKRAKKK